MASLGRTFDASQVAPSAPRDTSIIPPGKYPAQIVESTEKENSAKTGTYHELVVEIIDGEHKGRRIWTMLNLNNPNPQAVEIAERELSAICHATGKMNVTDTDQLHFIPMTISLKVSPERKDQQSGKTYPPKNEISGWAAFSAQRPGQTVQRQVAPPTQGGYGARPATPNPAQQPQNNPPSGGGGAPWHRAAAGRS